MAINRRHGFKTLLPRVGFCCNIIKLVALSKRPLHPHRCSFSVCPISAVFHLCYHASLSTKNSYSAARSHSPHPNSLLISAKAVAICGKSVKKIRIFCFKRGEFGLNLRKKSLCRSHGDVSSAAGCQA